MGFVNHWFSHAGKKFPYTLTQGDEWALLGVFGCG
jgi:hypothetical protein